MLDIVGHLKGGVIHEFHPNYKILYSHSSEF